MFMPLYMRHEVLAVRRECLLCASHFVDGHVGLCVQTVPQ